MSSAFYPLQSQETRNRIRHSLCYGFFNNTGDEINNMHFAILTYLQLVNPLVTRIALWMGTVG